MFNLLFNNFNEKQSLGHLIPALINVSFFVILLVIYWVTWNYLVKTLRKRIPNYKTYSWYRICLTVVVIGLTVLTLVITFVDNLSLFFGSLSVLSAALVFALQDFVSCFFSWIYIELTNQYRAEDRIQITSSTRQVSGAVSEIGLFRTRIREQLGGPTLDREQYTGKVITFPNNFIFKYSLSNLTRNHKVIWHTFNITITMESDYKKANRVLEKTLNETFHHLLLKPERYFDDNYEDIANFRPKVYHNIAASGVEFTIWFGCRVGMLRPVLELYSSTILDTLKKENLELAYNTYRITK